MSVPDEVSNRNDKVVHIMQARRVARLSLPLVIPSSIAAILFFAVAVCIQNWQLLLPAAWFALMAACSLSLFSHACLHFPPAAVDARGMLLTAVLLFGSVYQFWVSFILSGQSYSEDLGPNLASEILNVIQQLFIAAFWFIACITGAVGAAIAVRTFFSNKQRPVRFQRHRSISHLYENSAACTIAEPHCPVESPDYSCCS